MPRIARPRVPTKKASVFKGKKKHKKMVAAIKKKKRKK